tara:strand:+ start:603 stop:839 length:237 start_codon:yes stop_codon:yes gene_type:complete
LFTGTVPVDIIYSVKQKNYLEVIMTKKHFIKIAEFFRDNEILDHITEDQLDEFCIILKSTNSNFNKQRFIDECIGEVV